MGKPVNPVRAHGGGTWKAYLDQSRGRKPSAPYGPESECRRSYLLAKLTDPTPYPPWGYSDPKSGMGTPSNMWRGFSKALQWVERIVPARRVRPRCTAPAGPGSGDGRSTWHGAVNAPSDHILHIHLILADLVHIPRVGVRVVHEALHGDPLLVLPPRRVVER